MLTSTWIEIKIWLILTWHHATLTVRPQLDRSQTSLETLLIRNNSKNFVGHSAAYNNKHHTSQHFLAQVTVRTRLNELKSSLPLRLLIHFKSRFLRSASLESSWSWGIKGSASLANNMSSCNKNNTMHDKLWRRCKMLQELHTSMPSNSSFITGTKASWTA